MLAAKKTRRCLSAVPSALILPRICPLATLLASCCRCAQDQYPTLKYFHTSQDRHGTVYTGHRHVDDMLKWVAERAKKKDEL